MSRDERSYRSVIPFEAVRAPEGLKASLARYGSLTPFVFHGDILVDGLKRWSLLSNEQRLLVPVVESSAPSAAVARWLANASRPWNVIETALLLPLFSESERADFALDRRLALAPNLLRTFEVLATHTELWESAIDSALPMSIWRDLGTLEHRLVEAVRLMLSINGTVAEKRQLASLLRQAALKNLFPESLDSSDLRILLGQLQQRLSPRREDVMRRYEEALREIELPGDVDLIIDPVFEKPGVTVKLHLRRQKLAQLEKLRQSLDHLFSRIPEL